ncbi:hypothetical protein HDU90_007772 [Geranomyces variabilis]|nr:hypothetical protein HDU90_007772 [Geranomyces variabilis]
MSNLLAVLIEQQRITAQQHRTSERNMSRLVAEVSKANQDTCDLTAQVATLIDSNYLKSSFNAVALQIAELRSVLLGGEVEPPALLIGEGADDTSRSTSERAVTVPVCLRKDTPHPRRRSDLSRRLDDDNASTKGSQRGVNVQHLPKFAGKHTDEYEKWSCTLRVIKDVNKYSDHQIKRAIPLLFVPGSPAYNWFSTLDIETTENLDFEGWMELIREEYDDPEELIKAQAQFADCSPTSGKYKTFVEFIDDKIALQLRAYSADAAELMPVQTTIRLIVGHLPSEVRTLVNLTGFNSFTDLRRWTKQYYSSARTRDQNPCATRKRQHEPSTGNLDKNQGNRASNLLTSTSKIVETTTRTTTDKPLPDGTKRPPGPCRFCGAEHWSIYCWKNTSRVDPPEGKAGAYGRPKLTDKKAGKTYWADAYEDLRAEYSYFVSQGFCPTGHF